MLPILTAPHARNHPEARASPLPHVRAAVFPPSHRLTLPHRACLLLYATLHRASIPHTSPRRRVVSVPPQRVSLPPRRAGPRVHAVPRRSFFLPSAQPKSHQTSPLSTAEGQKARGSAAPPTDPATDPEQGQRTVRRAACIPGQGLSTGAHHAAVNPRSGLYRHPFVCGRGRPDAWRDRSGAGQGWWGVWPGPAHP